MGSRRSAARERTQALRVFLQCTNLPAYAGILSKPPNRPDPDDSAPRRPVFRAERIPGAVDLGIHQQSAFPGDHIAYFWENDDEFAAGVKFLEVGIEAGDHCVIFGHDLANARVRSILQSKFDCDDLEDCGKLTVIGGRPEGAELLRVIAQDFEAALGKGAKMLRLLGNIGWGKPNWPEEDAILEFEATVTDAVRNLPSLVVCMYDVRAVPGRAMFRGAFETHPITICRNVLRENPHYVPASEFIASLKKVPA